MWNNDEKKYDAAKVSTSTTTTTNVVCQNPYLDQTIKTKVTEYRGLTQTNAEKVMADEYKKESLSVVAYYCTTEKNEVASVFVLDGTKIDATASRADESNQWHAVITETTYTTNSNANWTTTAPTSVTIGTSKSIAQYYAGTAYSPVFHEDISGNRTVESITCTHYTQTEATTVTTVRQTAEPVFVDDKGVINTTYSSPEGWVMLGTDGYGQIKVKTGTRVASTAQKIMTTGQWTVTITTTVFGYY